MSSLTKNKRFKNIGFISTRIAGTDGVSLEIEKWAAVLERNGHLCFYFAGEHDRPSEKCMKVSEAHFEYPDIQKISNDCFGKPFRLKEISKSIHELKEHLKEKIYHFVNQFQIDLIIPENVLAIPMNIPLGMAVTEFIAETCFPTIAHHHDFYWERDRFLVNGVTDFLDMAFPPDLPSIKHVVINSLASEQLSYRKGVSNTIVHNVYDFAAPPPQKYEHCTDLRQRIGLSKDDLFILQPTRVVPRKWVERAVEIVSQLNRDNRILVISHATGDEGGQYAKRVLEYAGNLGVKIVFMDDLIGTEREIENKKGKLYTIGDVYRCADLVTYPSGYEGFGNAFLEAIYYRKPIVVNRYSIYISDIEPKDFDVITIDGFVDGETVSKIEKVLSDRNRREEMVEKNYDVALQHFSYEILEESLNHLIYILARRA